MESDLELELDVPTYYGDRPDLHPHRKEFDDPSIPVLVRPAEGVRVVLGTHDYTDLHKPDVQIERRPNGWAIFLHPCGGGDPSGVVYFLDDGQSFVIPECYSADAIQILDPDADLPLVDRLPENARNDRDDSDGVPSTQSEATAQLTPSSAVIDALKFARKALAGDSNDDEYDALCALVEALEKCNLVEWAENGSTISADPFVHVQKGGNESK